MFSQFLQCLSSGEDEAWPISAQSAPGIVQIGSNWLETPESEGLVSRTDLIVSIAVVGSRVEEYGPATRPSR